MAADFAERVGPFEEGLLDAAFVLRLVRRNDLVERRPRREPLRAYVVLAFPRWSQSILKSLCERLVSDQVPVVWKLVVCGISKKGAEQLCGRFW